MTSFKSKSGSNNANVMSPTQTKVLQECADCGSSNTKWASVNHGVVICDDCCLVHRSLGRSISIIKSISKSYWPQSLIDILYDLVRNGSNQIWESNLQSSEIQQIKQIPRKKPSHKDAISTKTNYIKAKYENLIFLSRGKYTSIEELNQQLISTVKTNNYEMSLRLLAQGADVNYKSQDDGLSCLHTAVVNGQLGQVELLCLYGADLNMIDRSNNSAYDLAMKNNLQHIADRLVELQFELTDELTYFLCNKRPDHKSGQHFFIPEINESENNEMPKHTKSRLLELPDHLFEELCKDVYDEADRRQIETIWKCSVNQSLAKEAIPFLVIKSCFSQTRNQLRQKLARFTTNEFSNLIIEILNEARNRFNRFSNTQRIQTLPRKFKKAKPEELSEEDLLYDKVPSDEDYASVASESTTANDYPQVTSPVLTRKVLQQQQQLNNQQYQANSSQKIISKEHKILELKTNFDKPFKINNTPSTPTRAQSSTSSNSGNGNLLSPTQSKFANTEQTINAILHSLNNQSDNSPFSRLDKRSNESLLDKKNFQDIKNENELMKSMINSLMEENAQLRADKMLLSTAVNDQNANSPANGEDRFALYSTVNKKSSSLRAINKLPTVNSPNKTLNWAEQQQQINSLKLHLKDANNGKDGEQILKIEIEKGNEFAPNRSRLDSTESEYENNTSKYFKTLTLSSPTNKKLDVLQVEEENEPQNDSNDNLNLFDNLKFMPKYVKHEHYNQLSSLSSSPNSACPLISPKFLMQNNKNQSDDTLTVSTTTPTLPTKDAVIKKMKKITKTIQELYKATKDSKSELYKQLCEKVYQSVNEMIDLFSQPYDSKDIQECISLLTENCKNLLDLMDKHYSQLCDNKPSTGINIAGHMSNSSSSSSAISSLSANAQNDDVIFKNTIVNNMINYCYDIVYNVKKLVCIIGVDN